MSLHRTRHPLGLVLLGMVLLANASRLLAQDAATPRREQLQPADDLQGPPYVTCKAWAVVDGRTGKLLFGQQENQPLDNASTTKIMTALVVLRLAQNDRDILQEQVTFSEQADKTAGSTSGIEAGERLRVADLMYGLLLPSGNDASVALAEHFGGRFPPTQGNADTAEGNGGDESKTDSQGDQPPVAAPPTDAAADAVNRFVAQMNRTAAQLGMKHTAYKNTHGLTAKGHHSTAYDLLILAHAAQQLDDFGHYVSTRRHQATLVREGKPPRTVVWENTNRLLATQGYDGVKTGTTTAAGACLVASGRRGDDHLLLAVLGSASSDARYVDARNLFRWAWQQRGHK